MSEVEQKVVLVTGASDGIGEATALEYAKLGYKVAITGRNQEKLNRVMETLKNSAPKSDKNDDFLAIRADFEYSDQVDIVVRDTVQKFGRLDILVNNAGYMGAKRFLIDEDFFDDFKNILQVNLMAATRLAQLAAPHLVKTKGVIVNVASIASRIAMPSISYSVSKAGLSMLTNTLANAFDGTGVRAITLSPGPIKTNISNHGEDSINIEHYSQIVPLRRVGSGSEVANTIVFLTSDKASYINGCEIDVDGGTLCKFGGVFSVFNKPLNATQ